MNSDIYFEIDNQQAENVMQHQNTANFSQIQLQPDVFYVDSTAENKEYVYYNYVHIQVTTIIIFLPLGMKFMWCYRMKQHALKQYSFSKICVTSLLQKKTIVIIRSNSMDIMCCA